jgi:GNAT superfamily N-acetyltransferase
MAPTEHLSFHPLTPEQWDDFAALFETTGVHSHCWCMAWRLRGTDFNALDDAGRKAAMHALVHDNLPVGVIGYLNGTPAAWCSIAPRDSYIRLVRSNTFPPLDDQPVWAVVCFYIAKDARGQGMAQPLLQAAVDYAISQGAEIVEGYPVESQYDANGKLKRDAAAYMGTLRAFQDVGFVEAAVNKKGRKIMRYTVAES